MDFEQEREDPDDEGLLQDTSASQDPLSSDAEGTIDVAEDMEAAEYIPQKKKYKLFEKGKILQEKMNKAFAAVSGGMSVRQASKEFHVSVGSLGKRVRMGVNEPVQVGRKSWISTEDEKQLEDWCLKMSRIGCPLSRNILPQVVKNILDTKKLLVFPPDNLPTRRWVDRFMTRHPNLSNRVPEHLGHKRALITPLVIDKFFKDLKEYFLAEHGIDAEELLCIENSERIFNCDETGFFLNANDRSSKVLVKKGTKNAYKLGGEATTHITVLVCVSASGHMLKPLILNSGKKPTVYEKFPDLDPTRYSVGCSDKGWMTGDIFFSWLTNIFNKELEQLKIKKNSGSVP